MYELYMAFEEIFLQHLRKRSQHSGQLGRSPESLRLHSGILSIPMTEVFNGARTQIPNTRELIQTNTVITCIQPLF